MGNKTEKPTVPDDVSEIEPVEDADAAEDVALTPQQEIFCLEYLKDFNATKAAKRAGYSEKTARQMGSENLSKPYIRKRLRDSLDAVLGDKAEDVKAIINELRIIAFSDIRDFVSWDGTGSRKLIDEATGKTYHSFRTTIRAPGDMGDKGRALAEISETEGAMSSSRKVKLHDKLRAIELMGKFYKIFTDKIEHTSPDGSMKPQVFVYLPKNDRESK